MNIFVKYLINLEVAFLGNLEFEKKAKVKENSLIIF